MKQWLVCIICVCAFSGLTDILIPDGKSKKTFKVVSAIALLCVFLYPLKNADSSALFHDFTLDSEEASSSFRQNYDEAVIAAYESGIKKVLEERLDSLGIPLYSISVECTSKADKIEIKKITVYVKEKDEKISQSIKAAIDECLNEETEIEIISG